MKTARDNQIIRFIESNRAITVKQCTDIFFEGNYRGCARRLQELETFGHLESHFTRDTNQKCFQLPGSKHITEHDIGILDFYAWIVRNNGEITLYKKEPRFLNGMIRPDAIFNFNITFGGNRYSLNTILEYDLNNYTNNTKLNVWYEKLAREKIVDDFLLVVARPTEGLRYNPRNFSIVYTDLKFNKFLEIALS